MSRDLTLAYTAALQGDFETLERMRDRVIPAELMVTTRPSSRGAFTLLEVALYAGLGIYEEKGPTELDSTDNTAFWLIQRSLELGDREILTRKLFDDSVTPMDRALSMLCPRTVLLLMELGVEPDLESKRPNGSSVVGHLVSLSDVPDKNSRVESIHRLVEDFRRVSAARAIIDDIEASPAIAP